MSSDDRKNPAAVELGKLAWAGKTAEEKAARGQLLKRSRPSARAEVAAIREEIRGDVAGIRYEIAELRGQLATALEIGDLMAEIKAIRADIQEVRSLMDGGGDV